MGNNTKKPNFALIFGLIFISQTGHSAVPLSKLRQAFKKQQKNILALDIRLSELLKNKKELDQSIESQKKALHENLKKAVSFIETEPLRYQDEFQNQRAWMVSKQLEKNRSSILKLKEKQVLALELEKKIELERKKLVAQAEELKERLFLLAAEEDLKKRKKVTHHWSDFSNFKGHLPLPVSGAIVSKFGQHFDPKTGLLTFQKGIGIRALSQQPVHSVASGRVVFAGPLKNYGQVVIVEHPGKFFTLYGQLSKIEVHGGLQVASKSVLGKTSQENFYFEVREKNVATNPLVWLKEG